MIWGVLTPPIFGRPSMLIGDNQLIHPIVASGFTLLKRRIPKKKWRWDVRCPISRDWMSLDPAFNDLFLKSISVPWWSMIFSARKRNIKTHIWAVHFELLQFIKMKSWPKIVSFSTSEKKMIVEVVEDCEPLNILKNPTNRCFLKKLWFHKLSCLFAKTGRWSPSQRKSQFRFSFQVGSSWFWWAILIYESLFIKHEDS